MRTVITATEPAADWPVVTIEGQPVDTGQPYTAADGGVHVLPRGWQLGQLTGGGVLPRWDAVCPTHGLVRASVGTFLGAYLTRCSRCAS